ncbi:MAG: sulfur carrier protein ThiS [Telluria sp.]
MIEIVLNGEPRQVTAAHTLAALVAELGLEGQAIALAVNRNVVPRQQWPAHTLGPRDQVDIVRAIGGG